MDSRPWLRYVTAKKINDATLDLDGLSVRSTAGEDLGRVEGLLIDGEAARTVYVVVDAGGWFKSKHFLVPIGYIDVSPDRDALVVSLTKDQVHRFPGFDLSEFHKLDDADFKRINTEIAHVCEPAAQPIVGESFAMVWTRASYRTPDWWKTGVEPHVERASADGDTTSPHFDGRAQPGDVIGIETEGERTYIGDTKKDESERRDEAVGAGHKTRG